MNEQAIRLEEQIISLFSGSGTEVYQGWILKKMAAHTMIYPLYHFSNEDIVERIQACEEISPGKSPRCVFRIVEHTNYFLTSRLESGGYQVQSCHTVVECCLNEEAAFFHQNQYENCKNSKAIFAEPTGISGVENIVTNHSCIVGVMRQRFLYLPDGRLSGDAGIKNIVQFAIENQIAKIVADIPESEELLECYEEAGFHKAYRYYRYQKILEDRENGYTK